MSKIKKLAAIALSACMLGSVGFIAACGDSGDGNIPDANLKQGTYRTYTSVMPSNWNYLSYADNNDTQIMNYINSNFYEYDYMFDESKGGKFNKDGTINSDAIVSGAFDVKYSAATKLEDVTEEMAEDWGYTEKQVETGGYAWKITLREDLKWDDGTPIDASDFVYTMKEQLNPDFQLMRAATYYNNIMVKNARNYLYNGSTVWVNADGPYTEYNASELDSKIVFTLGNPTENQEKYNGATASLRGVWGVPDSYTAADLAATIVASGASGTTAEAILALEGKTMAQIKSDAKLKATWDVVIGWWQSKPNEELDFFIVQYTYPEMSYDKVGVQSPSKYEIVVCLDSPIQCLKEDGSLSYQAAYSFASLPLVKKDLYEECKQEPQVGSELWTTNYCTSAETSASWGPYKLTSFQGGKSYVLERNDNWYGYKLEDNANQYNVTKIECEQLAEVNTQWLEFLSGNIDEVALDVGHKDDYRNSKYTIYTPGEGTYSLNLYGNLDVLKENGRNNGILAIRDFRKAISLNLDRDDYNAATTVAHQSCYGIIGPAYYYDVENAATLPDGGVYRNTEPAMKALLRVYGFTENADGTWTDGTRTYDTYEDAYEVMNGYNPTLAKELVKSAYEELTANADKYGYDSTKNIVLLYGTHADNDNTRRDYEYIKEVILDLVEDTPLEGKIVVDFDASFGAKWAEDFRAGAYDIASGTGFGGGAFDPAGMLQCYVDPDAGLMYSTWWDTKSEMMTFTMPEGDYDGAGEELTMSVYNWYCCLNGLAEAYNQAEKYNWGAGFIPESDRLELLAALEEVVLEQYYSIATTSQYSASVMGAKFSNITDEYNTFMGFGGMRYMLVNYTDSEWSTYVSQHNNDLESEYKKTE